MRPEPPAVEHEDTGEFLVAPESPLARPGPGRSRIAPVEEARPGEVLATEAALAALVLAAGAERSAVVATRSADRVRSEAKAGRRRLWQALLLLAALALAALTLSAVRLHPGGLP